ncbi:major capsid protein [Lentilactobacillus sp. SPB1-3]|uniref:Major capsid protein n=1 Tax=Lentilactobacillus terminaliae TaxID=3003483 RepID=A0ACD5DCK8_9LACO|nr:major capsid protein [Lentilactobacillus sp. SPB1-3]MCZ0978084.1 major capsid protein [Lentilactobacillus sp. SPB1-3]
MANIDELTNLQAMAVYYERKLLTLPPYLGETYFPATKIATDMLSYLTQKQGAPVMAEASTYDAQPTPMNRENFSKEYFQTNFFRSRSVLNENDLEEINRALFNGDDQLVKSLILGLFDDKTKMLLGMRTRREWMAMQALMTGQVALNSNGVTQTISYSSDSDLNSQVDTDWSDTENSNPIEDMRKAITSMKHKGITPNQILMNDDTFRLILNNERIKTTLWPSNFDTSKMMMTENQAVDFIISNLHVIPVVYDQGFVDEEATGTDDFTPFLTPGKVVLLNAPIPAQFAKTGSSSTGLVQSASTIGHMAFAPTPEELGLRNGKIASNTVQLFDTGVAYHEYYNQNLVQTEDLVSMNCLPSFEGSQSVFRLTIAKPTAPTQPSGQASTSSTSDGSAKK